MEAGADLNVDKRPLEGGKKSLLDEIFSRLPKRRFKGRWTIHLGAKNYGKNYLCLVFLRDGEKKNLEDWESQGRLDILRLSGGGSATNGRLGQSRSGLDHHPSSFMALFKTFKTNMAAVCELDSSKFSMDDVKMYSKRDSKGILDQIQRSAWLCEYDEVLQHVQAFLAENHRKSSSKTINLAMRWILDRESEEQAKDSRRDAALDRDEHHYSNQHRGKEPPRAQATAAAVNYHHHQHHHHHHRNCPPPQPQQQQQKRNNKKHEDVYRRYEVLESSDGEQPLEAINNNTSASHRRLLDEKNKKEPPAACRVQIDDPDCDSCPSEGDDNDNTNSLDDDEENENPDDEDHDDRDSQQLPAAKQAAAACREVPNSPAAKEPEGIDEDDDCKSVEVEVEVNIAGDNDDDDDDDAAIPLPPPSRPPPVEKPQFRKRKLSDAGLHPRSVSPVPVAPRRGGAPSPTDPPAPENGSARVVAPSTIRAPPGARGLAASRLAEAQETENDFGEQWRGGFLSRNQHQNAPKQAKMEPTITQTAHQSKQAANLSSTAKWCPPTTIVTRASALPERKASVTRHAMADEQILDIPSSQFGHSTLTGNTLSENGSRGKMNTIQMIRYIRKRWVEGGMPRNRAFKRLCAEDIPFKGMGGKRNEEIITAHDNYFQLAFRSSVIWDLVNKIFDKWEDGEVRGQSFYEDTDDIPDMKITCWAKMQGITDGESEAIVPTLKRVVSGDLTLPQMAEKYTTYKIHRRMIEAFCKYLRCTTWDQCKKDYPTIANNTEFQKFVPVFAAHKRKRPRSKKAKTSGDHMTASAPFPERFTTWITNALKAT